MDIVIVEHRIGQPVQVVQRPQRLRQFLVQAIAHLLRGGVGGDEDHGGIAAGQRRPVHLRAAAGLLEIGPAGDARHHETGGPRHLALQLLAADPLNRDAGHGGTGQKDVDPGLGAQPVDQAAQVGHQRCRDVAGDPHRNRAFETGHLGDRAAAFHPEAQVEEILRDLAVGPGGCRQGGGGKTAHRRQALLQRQGTAGGGIGLHRRAGRQRRQGEHR